MTHPVKRPRTLLVLLVACSFIPVMMAATRVVQIPLGAVPEDSRRLASLPVAYFLHSLAGLLFGVLGPLQFVRAHQRRIGTLHRLAGRVFVLAGTGLALSGLSLLVQVESITTQVLDSARGIFGLALISALLLGMTAAMARDMRRHRAWMIRAYAIGMGTGIASLVMFPVYLISGEPPTGLASDLVVVGLWLTHIALGEWTIRKLEVAAPTPPLTP